MDTSLTTSASGLEKVVENCSESEGKTWGV
jgi:hypothetical protein